MGCNAKKGRRGILVFKSTKCGWFDKRVEIFPVAG